jgi:hypothetical protein
VWFGPWESSCHYRWAVVVDTLGCRLRDLVGNPCEELVAHDQMFDESTFVAPFGIEGPESYRTPADSAMH